MNGGRNIITLILLPIVEEADIHLSECLMPKFQQSFNKSFSKVSAKVSVKFQQSFSQSFSCRKSFSKSFSKASAKVSAAEKVLRHFQRKLQTLAAYKCSKLPPE